MQQIQTPQNKKNAKLPVINYLEPEAEAGEEEERMEDQGKLAAARASGALSRGPDLSLRSSLPWSQWLGGSERPSSTAVGLGWDWLWAMARSGKRSGEMERGVRRVTKAFL